MLCHFLSLILFFRTLYSKTQRQLFLVILNYSQSLPLLSRTWSLLSPFHPACSFFALLVPFLPPKGTTLSLQLVSFLSTLYLFYPKPLSKKTQPLFLFSLIRVGHNYYCLFYIYFRSCDQELSPNHYRSILESLSYHSREII